MSSLMNQVGDSGYYILCLLCIRGPPLIYFNEVYIEHIDVVLK